jgi:hypothetical protein
MRSYITAYIGHTLPAILRATEFERRLAVKYKILVAHQSHPEDFRHEIDIDFIGTEWTEVAQEMVNLLNEDNFRDCIFKIDEPTAEE